MLSRSSEEMHFLESPTETRRKYALFAVGALVLFAVFLPVFAAKMSAWDSFKPLVAIEKAAWKVLPGQAPPAALWQSPRTRNSADHSQYMQSLRGQSFWLGTVFSTEQLTLARRARANHILLGYLNGSYEL